MTIKSAINVDPEILGGTPVFAGTRVPVITLFNYLEESSLEDFLEGFPSVSREQAESLIEWAAKMTINFLTEYESAA